MKTAIGIIVWIIIAAIVVGSIVRIFRDRGGPPSSGTGGSSSGSTPSGSGSRRPAVRPA